MGARSPSVGYDMTGSTGVQVSEQLLDRAEELRVEVYVTNSA